MGGGLRGVIKEEHACVSKRVRERERERRGGGGLGLSLPVQQPLLPTNTCRAYSSFMTEREKQSERETETERETERERQRERERRGGGTVGWRGGGLFLPVQAVWLPTKICRAYSLFIAERERERRGGGGGGSSERGD